MAEKSTARRLSSLPDHGSREPEGDALREELAQSREEVMRLRDLLIARDVEMGRLRGRLEQLEARTTRLLGAAAWLRRFGPPFARFRAMLRSRG